MIKQIIMTEKVITAMLAIIILIKVLVMIIVIKAMFYSLNSFKTRFL